jgi:DNA polymerase-3 subunit alpha (Gram-positive type)
MTKDYRDNLFKSRVFFLAVIGALVLVVVALNRDALLGHPSHQDGAKALARRGLPLDTPARDVTFAVFDTETTGIDEFVHRMVELAVVKFKAGEVIDSKTWLLDPERFIPAEAEQVHGITAEMVTGQPTFKEVAPEFIAFIDGCILMAHNASFDVRFLRREFVRSDIAPPAVPVLDSLRVFRAWFPKLSSYSLEAIADRLGIQDDEVFHRAEGDSLYVGRIFYQGLSQRAPNATIADLVEAGGDPLVL